MKRFLKTVGLVLAGTTWATPSIAHLDTRHRVELTATGEVPLPGDALYPEGIAVSRSGDLYVGSVAEGHILKLDRQTRNILKFSPPNADLMAVIGVYVSNDDKVVYACSSDPKGLFASRRSEVVAFDVQSGSVKRRAALPEGGLCNDIAELDDGTILVTDSFGGSIFALAPNEDALSVWAQSPEFIGEGFNLNGIVTIGDTVFAVKYNSGELFRFSSSETGVTYQRVELSRPLNGPDGLERIGDSKLLVVDDVLP